MSPERKRSALSRSLTVATVAVIAAATLGAYVLTRSSVHRQERLTLDERATEVEATLSTSIASVESSMRLLGATYAAPGANGRAFASAARSLLQANVLGVGVVRVEGDTATVEAGQGKVPETGSRLDAARTSVARRAAAANDLVSGLVDDHRLVIALGRPDGLVVYEETAIDTSRPTPQPPGSPFSELDLTLYRTTSAQRAQRVLTTTDDQPTSGTIDRRTIEVGAERWLMVSSPARPLTEGLTRAAPWLVLIAGLVIALLAAAMLEVLGRRRRYALDLVDARTAELRQLVGDLEQARAIAASANQAKSQFVSRMSHELRTPLNAVLGFAQILELGEHTPDDREAVEMILKGGNHLLELINELLDISRMEAGDLALSPEPVYVVDTLREALDLVRPIAAEAGLTLTEDRQSGCQVYVMADTQRLKQILLNLLSNAIKYNRPGGSVTLACRRPSPTRLRIAVTDTGIGIPAEKLGLLFVPFERLGAERTTVEGAGIGLALSLRLAEAMGGTISVDSVAGEGSTFWVELPIVEGPVERYERLDGSSDAEAPPATTRRSLLYIEDNLANLKLIERLLGNRTDLEILPAMQGRIGLGLARDHHPALILLDLHLPDMDGYEVLHELRDDPATASIPVIVVSADATHGQIQRLLAAGAAAYLTKPLDVRELLRLVDRLAGER